MKIGRVATTLSIMLVAPAAWSADQLDVTVDKGTLLRLETNAKIVLVAQPGIADAVVESPRLIFILGRRPGETNLFVLDARGRTIREADVVVHADGPRLVSVHRGGREATLSCAPRCSSVATPGQPARGRAGAAGGPSAPPGSRAPSTPGTSPPAQAASPTAPGATSTAR